MCDGLLHGLFPLGLFSLGLKAEVCPGQVFGGLLDLRHPLGPFLFGDNGPPYADYVFGGHYCTSQIFLIHSASLLVMIYVVQLEVVRLLEKIFTL